MSSNDGCEGTSRAYQKLAMELIVLCRCFVQAYEPGSNYFIQLKKLLIVADNALESAHEARNTGKECKRAKKFRKAIHLLSRFEKDFPFKDCRTPVTKEAKMSDTSKFTLPFGVAVLMCSRAALH